MSPTNSSPELPQVRHMAPLVPASPATVPGITLPLAHRLQVRALETLNWVPTELAALARKCSFCSRAECGWLG